MYEQGICDSKNELRPEGVDFRQKTSPNHNVNYTYSLGFFFGPGFPLGFGVLSAIILVDLFDPAFAPGPLFFGISAGGEPAVGGAGVAFDSDAFSDELPLVLLTASAVVSARPGVEEDEGADFCFEFLRDADLGSNSLSIEGDRLRVTILDNLVIFLPRDADADETVVVVVDMAEAMMRLKSTACKEKKIRSGQPI